MADKMFTTWDGMDVHAKVADRANADAEGNSLTLGLDASGKVATIGGKEIAGGGGGGASYTSGDGISISEENEISVKTDGSTIHTNASGELEVLGGGGGGGGGNVSIVNCMMEWVSDGTPYGGVTHLHTVSMTPEQIIASIESGNAVFARIISMYDGHVNKLYQIPLVRFLYLDGYPTTPILEFVSTSDSDGSHWVDIRNSGSGWEWTGDEWTVSDVDG